MDTVQPQAHTPQGCPPTQPSGAPQGSAAPLPPRQGMPDTNGKHIAICTAAREFADAMAYLATFAISGEALATLHHMLGRGLQSIGEVQEQATAELTYAHQRAPQSHIPLAPGLSETKGDQQQQHQAADAAEQNAYTRRLQRAIVQAMRYKRHPQTDPNSAATIQ